MKYDDLDKTKDLFDIVDEVPSPIENIEMEGVNKENLAKTETVVQTAKEEKKPTSGKSKKQDKKSIKEAWLNLSKKKKVAIIIVGSILLILLLILIVFLCLDKAEEKPTAPKEPDAPAVIVEKDSYIYKDGVLSLLDKEENELGTYECKNKDEKLCYVANYAEEEELDVPKNVYEDDTVLERVSTVYKNKYVFIYDNTSEKDGLIILYNLEEKKEEGTYSLIKGFSNSDYVILKDNNNKFGAIEFSDTGIVSKFDFSFDYLGMLPNNKKVVVKTNNKYFIYSNNGKIDSKAILYPIKSYNDKYIVANNNGYYVFDYKGNLVIDESYQYITLLDDYVALVQDQKLYIRDYNKNKYNEVGISLNSSDYNPINVYSKEKSLIETKKAFDISIDDGGLNVTYVNRNKEKTETINVNDGKVSANYPFINYFDGELYFYNDEDKANLIGIYKCSNKNNLTKDSKEFNNCLIAKESFFSNNEMETDNSNNVGWLPIYNERFVFLSDSIDPNNPTIVLYDLKNKKTLSKYSAVDASVYSKENKVSFRTVENQFVMARNKNNKYGIIKIGAEVGSVVGFNYDKIEKLGDHYLVMTNGKYSLLNSSGTKVADSPYKIVDFNDKYLSVSDDGKYYVYNYKGEAVDETGYLHITLEDSYYAVVTAGDKKLDLKKYDNPNFGLKTPLDLGTDDYKNAYKVGKNSSGYLITISSTGKTIQVGEDGKTDEERASEIGGPGKPSGY